MDKLQKINNQLPSKSKTTALDRLKKFKTNAEGVILDGQRMFYQYVVFVMDASRSMRSQTENGISKAEEINKSIRNVMERLEKSKHTNSFDIGMWCFSDDTTCVFKEKKVRELSDQDFNPMHLVEKPRATYLNSTLLSVEKEIDNYCKKHYTKNHRALVILLTDGSINDRVESLETIARIKKNSQVTVSAMYLARHIDTNDQYYSWDEKNDEIDYNSPVAIEDVINGDKRRGEAMKVFASEDALFVNDMDPEAIRRHMIKSVSVSTSKSLGFIDKALLNE